MFASLHRNNWEMEGKYLTGKSWWFLKPQDDEFAMQKGQKASKKTSILKLSTVSFRVWNLVNLVLFVPPSAGLPRLFLCTSMLVLPVLFSSTVSLSVLVTCKTWQISKNLQGEDPMGIAGTYVLGVAPPPHTQHFSPKKNHHYPTPRSIGPFYRGVWLCIAGFWDLQRTSFWDPMTLRPNKKCWFDSLLLRKKSCTTWHA